MIILKLFVGVANLLAHVISTRRFTHLFFLVDFSLFKGLRFSSRRRSVLIIIQRQLIAFYRKNINRMRFDLYGHHEIVLGLIELHFVDMKSTTLIGEVQSFDVFLYAQFALYFWGQWV